MNTLKFKLLSNKKIAIDEEIPYYINGSDINFKIGDTLYKYNLIDDILYKNDKELSLTIDPNNNIIYVKLMVNGALFNMPLENTKISKKNNEIMIKYRLISDEITENEIWIKY